MIAATILPLVGRERRSGARDRAGLDARADGRGDHGARPASRSSGSSPTCCRKPTMIGYMNGLALTILVGQLPKLFGFSVDADGLIDEARAFVNGARRRRDGARPRSRSAWLGLVADPRARSAGCRRSRACWSRSSLVDRRASVVFDLADHGVSLVGTAAPGVPAAHRPDVDALRPRRCWSPARSASRSSSLADTISTASAFAARTGQEVDGNQEMIGIGAANIAAGLLPGLPGQHQRLAHRGRRAGRRQDPGHRRGRRGRDHADAGARAGAAARTCRSRPWPRW